MKETKAAIVALRAKAKQLESVIKILEKLDGIAANYRPAKRKLSAQGRKKIQQAQAKRWKVFRSGKKAA